MSRKPKFSKEIKIQACIDYKAGCGSFESIAKSIGADFTAIRLWYSTYEIHGDSAFDHSNTNRSYTKEFKQSVVDEYLSGNFTFNDLSAKYIISSKVLRNWVKKSYNGIELKDYDPKGDVYTMKSRKTTFEERTEIAKWVIANDMNYKEAANKFANSYANIYKWTKAYVSVGSEALKDKKRGPKNKAFVDEDSLSEIDKLKLELERERALRKRREFELEVLKKKEEFENQNRYRK
jgi:transposase-like protein